MPKKLIRVLVAVLVALVVPLQGAAALAAGQCMALGHHQDGGQDQPHGHEGSGDAAGAHEHAAVPAAEGGGEAAKYPHCGPCAACCATASIAGRTSLPIPGAPANTKYLLAQSPLRGFKPHGIDRPPLAL